jgi:hypothetical protein
MEMIDVLQRLKEIQESRPGVVDDAVANLENLNPKTEGAVKAMLMDLEQDAAELSKEEFIKKHGSSHMDIWNRVQNEKEEFGENKAVVKESIQITADTPEEASMMMRMLQMAGVKPLDQDMINQPKTASSCDGCDENCECGGNKTDEAQDGGFASSTTAPDTKVQDTDTLVNFHSGGLNRQKGTHPKVAGGDNPMQRTESLSDSLKQQYAEFKANYLNAVNEQKKDK